LAQDPGIAAIVVAAGVPVGAAMLLGRSLDAAKRPAIVWFVICGAATAYLAWMLEEFAAPALIGSSLTNLPPIELAFIFVAPIEEIAKFALIQHQVSSNPILGGRSAAMIGLAIGAGFAALENALYVVDAGSDWATVALSRMLTAIPFHMANGLIAGLLIWRASRSGSALGLLGALAIVVLLHGAYDAPLFLGEIHAAKFAFVLGLTVAIAIGSYKRLPSA
jgi:RsiW-degrading membrane proteinase PrsW (M82 family)